jgi:hypothetical protein
VAQYADAPRRRHHPNAEAIKDTPVMFPPGWARLGTIPVFDWVANDYNDRDILCCLLCRQRGRHIQRYDNINLEPNEFNREFRKPIQLPFGGAKFECNVATVHVAKFAQPFP